MRHACFDAISPGLGQHRLRDVKASDLRTTRGEGENQSANAAAEVQRPRWCESRIEMFANDGEHCLDVALARSEKLFALNARRAPVEFRRSQHGKIGIRLSETLPVFVGIVDEGHVANLTSFIVLLGSGRSW